MGGRVTQITAQVVDVLVPRGAERRFAADRLREIDTIGMNPDADGEL